MLDDDTKEETNDKKSEEKVDDKSEEKSEDKSNDSEEKSEEKPDKTTDDKSENNKKDNKDNENKVTMNELKEAIDKLSDKVTSLEAQLHIAKESLDNQTPVNYDAIETWINEEFAPSFEATITNKLNGNNTNVDNDEIVENLKKWIVEEFAPLVQGWITEEFAPEVQNWVTEEFAPEVQNWVCEEFAPEVQNWVCEEFAPEVENWVCEEFAPEVQNWMTDEFAPVIEGWMNDEFSPVLENKVNENVSQYLSENNNARLHEIDSLLETLSNDDNADVKKIVAEQKDVDKYAGVFVVENMPSEYKPSWNMLDEARKDEIVRSSRMYDFTKYGVLESFWSNVDFNAKKENEVEIKESKSIVSDYHNNVMAQMMRLRKNVNV